MPIDELNYNPHEVQNSSRFINALGAEDEGRAHQVVWQLLTLRKCKSSPSSLYLPSLEEGLDTLLRGVVAGATHATAGAL